MNRSEVECLCPCEGCDASGRVWVLQKGAGTMATQPCTTCGGIGRRWRRLTAQEKRELSQKLITENP